MASKPSSYYDGDKADDPIQLYEAVRNQDIKSVSRCLRNGASVNERFGIEGLTPLHCAAKNNFRKIALKLVKYGADVNALTKGGRPVLHVAIVYNATAVASLLLRKGADTNAVDGWGRTALHFAASYESKIVSMLIRRDSENVNNGDNWQLTPLHLAAMEDNADSTKKLLRGGARINNVNEKGRCALHFAARFSSTKTAFELMKHGANINVIDIAHCTALHHAAKSKDTEIIKELIRRGASVNARNNGGRTALHVAVSVDSKQTITELLRHEADINAIDDFGSTPLHQAAMCNNREAAAMLVYSKADATLMDSIGHTALHLAAIKNKKEVAEAILQADPNLIKLENREGQSALHVSASGGFEELVKLLLQKNASVNAIDNKGNTVLHYALAEKRHNVVSILLKQKALLLNPTDKDGNSFLHLWARLSPPNFAFIMNCGRSLMQAGAVVNARSSSDQTPLHLATTWEAASLLVDNGAWTNVSEMHGGETPLLTRVKSLQNASQYVYEQQDSTETQIQHWQKLLAKGFDPWVANNRGETVLLSLLINRNKSLAKSLIETVVKSSKDVNKKHTNGLTILHIICSLGNDELQEMIDSVIKLKANVNVVNFEGETPLHLVCRKTVDMVDNQQSNVEQAMFCWTASRLLTNGADPSIEDHLGQSCLNIAKTLPTLSSLLKKPVGPGIVPPLLKWSHPKSENHRFKVAQVVRGHNCKKINHFHFHKEPIGSGAFGHVFSGIDERNGREIAVKRIEKQRLLRHEERREISILVKLRDCDEVVRYISHCEDDNFVYLILDLMEGMLEEYLDKTSRDSVRDVSLCMDLVKGLSFLHQHCILHRDIKPGNVLYKTHPRLCLKLADFGLSGKAAFTNSTTETYSVIHIAAGTRCWMAPELLRTISELEHSEMSDVFACGLVIHYILTGKKHPFAPSTTQGRSGIDITNETERNIMSFNLVVDRALSHEAIDLITVMLREQKTCRPTAQTVLRHPFFWSKTKKARFLEAVGNQPEIQKPRHAVMSSSAVELQLENTLGKEFDSNPWESSIIDEYVEMTCFGRGRRYNTCSAVELIRFIRNSYAHVSDAARSSNIKKRLLEDFVYFSVFPSMLMQVYRAVTDHGWTKEREEIKRVLDKE